MISEADREIIARCARKYGVLYVLVFGSSLDSDTEANDIDLAVKGIEPRLFFKFYAELIKHLSKPVDLVDLSFESSFTKLIEKRGVRVYG